MNISAFSGRVVRENKLTVRECTLAQQCPVRTGHLLMGKAMISKTQITLPLNGK